MNFQLLHRLLGNPLFGFLASGLVVFLSQAGDFFVILFDQLNCVWHCNRPSWLWLKNLYRHIQV
jgi:hypothetical protein